MNVGAVSKGKFFLPSSRRRVGRTRGGCSCFESEVSVG